MPRSLLRGPLLPRLRLIPLILGLALGLGLAQARAAEPSLPSLPSEARLEQALESFGTYAEDARRQWGVPGLAVAVVRGGETIWLRGLGVKRQGGAEPVDPDTVFQIGSNSKAFTSALMAMLVDEKKAAWDDRVIDHLPEFRLSDPWVTREFRVFDLMAQHSGLAPYSGDLQAIVGFDRAHILASLRHLPFLTSFRTAYAYQNHLFLAAAAIIEKHMGLSFEQALQARIFTPLGMKSASATRAGYDGAANAAAQHMRLRGQAVALPRDWIWGDWVYTYGPAGGVNASARDMGRWLALHLGRGEAGGPRLLSPESADFLHTPQTTVMVRFGEEPQAHFYCQGWLNSRSGERPVMIWHNGDTNAMHAAVAFMPSLNLGIAVLGNLSGVALPETLARQFFDLCLGLPAQDQAGQELAKLKEKDTAAPGRPAQPADAQPPLALTAYEGLYANPIYGQARVERAGRNLALILGPKAVPVSLEPFNRDLFMAVWPEMPDQYWAVEFRPGAEGEIQEFYLPELVHEAGGRFVRVKP